MSFVLCAFLICQWQETPFSVCLAFGAFDRCQWECTKGSARTLFCLESLPRAFAQEHSVLRRALVAVLFGRLVGSSPIPAMDSETGSEGSSAGDFAEDTKRRGHKPGARVEHVWAST